MPEREAHHFAVDLCRSRPDAFDLDQVIYLLSFYFFFFVSSCSFYYCYNLSCTFP